MKSNPSIHLYVSNYKHVKEKNELYLFEYEMKTSETKQQKTIGKIQEKAKQKFRSPNPHE
ncbi:MAG TPA: hypothetical protein VI934_01175 [Candidatus Nanoarchaeia archaeon]|nr:hypothetical protein [Candidatus Nanoarchaeia archaeon]